MQKKDTKWQCRWSPTLGALEDTHQKIWGTKDYENTTTPTVFFGLYGLPDFMAFRQHKGEKHILWAGTDILHLKNGYWVDEIGEQRVDPKPFCEYLNKFTNWCENDVEAKALMKLGINAKIQPSYLGDINEMKVSFKPGNKVYSSVSGDNFEQYGWDKITNLAEANPQIEFHLYGNTATPKGWEFRKTLNMTFHGRVPKEQMNAEIAEMQGGLRMTEFDGCSEILVKSWLMGQYPISLIDYPFTLDPKRISSILNKKQPNWEAVKYWRQNLNKYPWNIK